MYIINIINGFIIDILPLLVIAIKIDSEINKNVAKSIPGMRLLYTVSTGIMVTKIVYTLLTLLTFILPSSNHFSQQS
jgi:hypothetical protein